MGSGDGIKGVLYSRSVQYYYNRYTKNKSKRSGQDIAGFLILTLPSEDSGDRDELRTVSNLIERGLVLKNGGWDESGPAKSIISCTSLPARVKWSPSQTWTSESSTVFPRDTAKRETITGIKLEGPGWQHINSVERVKYVCRIQAAIINQVF